MSGDEAARVDRSEPTPAFERQDAPARGVTYAVLGLFAAIAVSAIFVGALLYSFEQPGPAGVNAPPQGPALAPEAPRLETQPAADGATVRAKAEQKLEGYAWVDHAQGIARIPIERAMELTAQRGWPDDQRKATQ